MSSRGWIGVDLDGTLAEYAGWVSEEHIGHPVPMMLERVKAWLAEGKDVRIFTARVDDGEVAVSMGNTSVGEKYRDIERITSIIQDWCQLHIGVRLPVMCKKDYGMIELWDDRAKQVIPNTGISIESENARLRKAIEDAPHDEYCSSRGVDEMYPKIPVPCDCWKSKALGEQNGAI